MRSSNSQSKTLKPIDKSGKTNPRSKKIQAPFIKTFLEDQALEAPQINKILTNVSDLPSNIKRKSHSTKNIKLSQNDHTEKKIPMNIMTQTNDEKTLIKKKKQLKKNPVSTIPKNEYIYIVDPQTETMKKYIVHQGQTINEQLRRQEYIPPFQNCDEDCESTQEIVKKGIEYSKNDFLKQIQRRKNLPEGNPNAIIQPLTVPNEDSGDETDDSNCSVDTRNYQH